MEKCLYCGKELKEEVGHFSCVNCGDAMCDDCYEEDKEHDQHFHAHDYSALIFDNVDKKELPGDYVCEHCIENEKVTMVNHEDVENFLNNLTDSGLEEIAQLYNYMELERGLKVEDCYFTNLLNKDQKVFEALLYLNFDKDTDIFGKECFYNQYGDYKMVGENDVDLIIKTANNKFKFSTVWLSGGLDEDGKDFRTQTYSGELTKEELLAEDFIENGLQDLKSYIEGTSTAKKAISRAIEFLKENPFDDPKIIFVNSIEEAVEKLEQFTADDELIAIISDN